MLLKRITRRRFLQVSGAAAAAAGGLFLNLPGPVQAALVDPYTGSIPLLFPLKSGTYQPLADNWHGNRDGSGQTWSHQNSPTQRAHDGNDVFPKKKQQPVVYAPVSGIISAVLSRPVNQMGTPYTYLVADGVYAPPWDYSTAVDDAHTPQPPLYGNFVWIYSTDANSQGYYVFFAHLKYETTYLTNLTPGTVVTNTTPVGVLGDTGNATGSPQLHVEIHYPRDPQTLAPTTFTCTHCSPNKAGLTAISPAAALAGAAIRR